MSSSSTLDAALRQFVLGSLDESRRLEIEQRLVTDPDAFEALELVEEELVEAYADGTLSAADRQRFERHFLTSPARQRQVAFIRLLRQQAASTLAPPTTTGRTWFGWFSPAWAAPLAASLCAAVGLSVWLVVRQASLQDELRSLDARRASQEQTANRLLGELNQLSARTRQLESTVAREQGGVVSPGRLALVSPPAAPEAIELTPGRLRDGGTLTRVVIPAGAAVVRFRLVLRGPEYPSFRAVFHNANGDELWSVSKLQAVVSAGSRAVTVVAPAELLVRDDYEIRLRGVAAGGREEPVATYVFRKPS